MHYKSFSIKTGYVSSILKQENLNSEFRNHAKKNKRFNSPVRTKLVKEPHKDTEEKERSHNTDPHVQFQDFEELVQDVLELLLLHEDRQTNWFVVRNGEVYHLLPLGHHRYWTDGNVRSLAINKTLFSGMQTFKQQGVTFYFLVKDWNFE